MAGPKVFYSKPLKEKLADSSKETVCHNKIDCEVAPLSGLERAMELKLRKIKEIRVKHKAKLGCLLSQKPATFPVMEQESCPALVHCNGSLDLPELPIQPHHRLHHAELS